MTDFSENLRYLCQFEESASHICRVLGINRQQFGKYLSGVTVPSSHRLNQIATFFDVETSDFFLDHRAFKEKNRSRNPAASTRLPNALNALVRQAFPGQLSRLRPLTGYYRSYFPTPDDAGKIMCSLICLKEEGGYVYSKTIERSKSLERPSLSISKYVGIASYLNGYVFVSEFESLMKDSVVETILSAPYRSELQYLSGLTFGNSSNMSRKPFAARVVWKFLGKTIDLRSEISKCAELPRDSLSIDSVVKNLLEPDQGEQGGTLLAV